MAQVTLDPRSRFALDPETGKLVVRPECRDEISRLLQAEAVRIAVELDAVDASTGEGAPEQVGHESCKGI